MVPSSKLPGTSPNRAPVPSASNASTPRTLCTMLPYRKEREPQLLFAVMPPIVARLAVDGSTGKNSLCLRRRGVSPASTTPGSTRARRPLTSTDITRSRCLLQSMTSAWATVCPHCEVPPPRGNTGTPSSRAIAIAAAASPRRLLAAPRHDARQRLDLVDRRVGRIASAAERVEQHLALRLTPQPG